MVARARSGIAVMAKLPDRNQKYSLIHLLIFSFQCIPLTPENKAGFLNIC